MGNCVPKQTSRSSPAVAAAESPEAVRVYGSESCPVALRIQIALLYKAVPVLFNPPESPPAATAVGRPLLQCGGETVAGTEESLLQFVDSRFPRQLAAAAAAAAAAEGEGTGSSPAAEVATVTALQHRSMERHLEGMAADLVASGGGAGGGGGKVLEARKLGKRYAQLVELMLEHAQMEERLLFPALEWAAGRGVCKAANKEHARDLPIVNGIREDLKALLVMEVGTPLYKEALLNLSLRFQTLQGHCKQHFAEEESELLPLLGMVERARTEEGIDSLGWVAEVMQVMEATHSHLFSFFMAGLLPQEAMQYLDLVCRRTPDQQRLVTKLRSLAASLEGQRPPFINDGNPIKPQ